MGAVLERTSRAEVVPLGDGFHRVSTPTAGVIGFVHETEGRFEVLRGRVRSATRAEGAYRTLDVAVIALTYS
ncbi:MULTISPECIES: hypothetical protein [unclassified Frigoribacterium]|jgi:hypothetical protein|uniref:hypothetical protein n=1 Tax=unclassified Frigoribacterium TaxID=2627005 RepID=UPI000FBB2CE3|nr:MULTISPECIES: hypothetical protein [unclassified Frigoribacterium]ROP78012.1 hypothetical protein EDF18_0653 [Frigoribacterium sp. PhB107]TDT65855.1 hypothetical protein EDF20_0653 [Frigoribacterium sp. PhB116]MBD8584730.1 hypothetical protein [Frigoribacterium sp. CFBP 8766]MBD8609488.1 hypothetical protein [Frigoribacterium sp. CFBP 13729]MBF4578587.1 hypothetical protein [Frigoribacterium sp. VKM Ac-2530]